MTTVAAGATSHQATGLAANTPYYFRVRSTINGTNDSPNSNTATATTLAADGNEYYVSPGGGSGGSGTSASPWHSFSIAVSTLQPGDTLLLNDGTYHQPLNITQSGTPGNPITVKATNDGGAIVDGQGTQQPLKIEGVSDTSHRSYIDIEGIVFENSNTSVVRIKWADHINLRRVSAYNADPDGNHLAFSIWLSDHILVEDAAASGSGRKQYSASDSDFVTFRRVWGRWFGYNPDPVNGTPWGSIISLYGANDAIVENAIVTKRPANGQEFAKQSLNASMGANSNGQIGGNNNRYLGSVSYDTNTLTGDFNVTTQKKYTGGPWQPITGNEHRDDVSINGGRVAFYQRADDSWSGNQLTAVNSGRLVQYEPEPLPVSPDFVVSGDLKNSSLVGNGNSAFADWGIRRFTANSPSEHVGTFTHSYNNLFDITNNYSGTSQGTGETFVDPGYDVATYGKGAYLIRPAALKGQGDGRADIGAEVLYRYVDGVLTNEPLWAVDAASGERMWPMEDRIQAETARLFGQSISITWETDPRDGVGTGGLWKTLAGVYPATLLAPEGEYGSQTAALEMSAQVSPASQSELFDVALGELIGSSRDEASARLRSSAPRPLRTFDLEPSAELAERFAIEHLVSPAAPALRLSGDNDRAYGSEPNAQDREEIFDSLFTEFDEALIR